MEDQKIARRPPSRFKNVCVFCGSSTGKRDSYREAAIQLGLELVARGADLVYGGGSIGLMGLVSQTVHRGGRRVLGIIPRSLMAKEITGEPVGEVRAVASMHQRKAEMARHSDCFIALPGGYGTLEELLEVITWAQLGIHDKPVCKVKTTISFDVGLSSSSLFLQPKWACLMLMVITTISLLLLTKLLTMASSSLHRGTSLSLPPLPKKLCRNLRSMFLYMENLPRTCGKWNSINNITLDSMPSHSRLRFLYYREV